MRKKNLFLLIFFILLILIMLNFGPLFSQRTSNNDGFYDNNFDINPYRLIEPIESETHIDVNSDVLLFLLSKQSEIVAIHNQDDMNFIDLELDDELEIKSELIIETLDFFSELDIESAKVSYESYSKYVSPKELGNNNFIIIARHVRMEEFKNIKTFYKVYLNGEHVGDTKIDEWNDVFYFFPYKLEINEEYRVKLEKMFTVGDSNDFVLAPNFSQPNLEDITIVNDSDDKIKFLIIFWVKQENTPICKVFTEYNNEKYLKRNSTIWETIKSNYLNQ